jgi:5-methylcytosine-specific restriction endonuclease McrA
MLSYQNYKNLKITSIRNAKLFLVQNGNELPKGKLLHTLNLFFNINGYRPCRKLSDAVALVIKHWTGIDTKKPKRKSVCKPNRSVETSFYLSPEWCSLRTIALKLYGRRCMKCGSKELIHVDHIRPISKFPDLKLSLTNLQVLCKGCNEEKSNIHCTDYRTNDHKIRLVDYIKIKQQYRVSKK